MKTLLTKEHFKTIYLVLKALEENQIVNPISDWELDFYDHPLVDNEKVRIALKAVKGLLPKEDVEELDKHVLIRKYGTFNNEIDERVYSRIQNALANLKRVEIEYFSIDSGNTTKRKIDIYYANRKYVIAFDHLRNDMRKFRTSRIVKAKLLPESYTIPLNFDKRKFL